MSLRVVDLFSGCGGMSMGFQNAGYELVSAYEFWDSAIEVYKQNFTHPVIKADLSDTKKAIPQVTADAPDIIIGGPPCQDFSSAGKRIEADKANLTRCYAEIVTAVHPRFFVMENVGRAANSNAYKEAREVMKKGGYGLTETILDASYCGVPQTRKRFVCIGVSGKEDGALMPYITRNLSEKPLTVREYFGNSLDFEYYYRHPRNYSRRGIFSIDEPAPTIRGVNRPVPAGYPGNSNDACAMNSNIRALTTLERSMIQTFPPTFKWLGNKTEKEQMIGNAVPVKLAEFIARCIQEFALDSDKINLDDDEAEFKAWLMNEKEYSERSSSDAVSRLKRADNLLPIDGSVDYLTRLSRSVEFNSLPQSVKPQLKRSVNLYEEFREWKHSVILD